MNHDSARFSNMYQLEHRHQDSGWQSLGPGYAFSSKGEAIMTANELSLDSICYGMVRVVCDGEVVTTFSAGIGG